VQANRRLEVASLIIFLYFFFVNSGKIEKNEMGGEYGAYGAGERGVLGSGGET